MDFHTNRLAASFNLIVLTVSLNHSTGKPQPCKKNNTSSYVDTLNVNSYSAAWNYLSGQHVKFSFKSQHALQPRAEASTG